MAAVTQLSPQAAPGARYSFVAKGGDSYTLTADTGAFALSGTAADLDADRQLAASAGSFTLTGSAATLTKSGVSATGGCLVRLRRPTNEVNWDDPLNKGLIHWWRMRQGDSWQRIQDYGRDGVTLLATAATDPDDLVPANAKNLQYAVDLDANSEAFEAANVSANVNDYTAACWIKPIAGSNRTYVSHHALAGSNDGWRVSSTNTSLLLVLGGVAAYTFSGPTLTYDEWQFVAVSVSGSTATGFVNFDSATTGIGSLIGTPTRYQVGSTKAGGGVGTTSDVRIYDRALSESELHDLYVASRTGYKDQFKRRYAPVSLVVDGALAYTLTADTGAFTLTGNDVDPDADRQLTADTGAFTLSGTATDLDADRQLAASTGAYTLTGNDATLTKSSFAKFIADTGSFTLTGNDTALKADHDVAASTGSYTLTGNSANLPADRQLAAGTASVSLTGNDATLTYGAAEPTLVAATGSFTETGNDATLTVSRKLTADTTSYTVAGNDTATKASRKFLATVASFDLDGPAVNLELSRRIALDTLTYNLTGVNTRLSYSEEDVSSIIQATSASIRCPRAASASIRGPLANGSISCADSDGTFVTP